MRRVEHNMPKIWYYGVFSLFHRCRASARLPSQKQKSIHTLCIFGAEQFETSRFLLKQGTKSPPYCRMARFLTQVRQKYAVLNHIGFNSPRLICSVQFHIIYQYNSCVNAKMNIFYFKKSKKCFLKAKYTKKII